MPPTLTRFAVLATAFALALTAASPAHAAAGSVAVFSAEFTPLGVYADPAGCTVLPPGAHVLANMTDQTLTFYSDPACLAPLGTVRPGYGSHVPPIGAFSI